MRAGIAVLQGIVVAAAAALGVWAARRVQGVPDAVRFAPLAVFLLSPQLLLYARQAVNELFLGALVMALWRSAPDPRRGLPGQWARWPARRR